MPSSRTNLEIEIKLRVADLPTLIRRLRRLGAVTRGRVLERNTLFDTPDAAFRRQGRLLRFRIDAPARSVFSPAGPSRAALTFKAPAPLRSGRGSRSAARPLYKEQLERELVIRAPRRWPSILRSLGFRPGFYYEKYRTTFRLGRLHLDLDETPVGIFLELEGNPQMIGRVSRKLGYSPADYIRSTYWGLNAADCRRRGRIPGNMVFHS